MPYNQPMPIPRVFQTDTQSTQTAWILSVGTELILGQTVDTNTAWLATQLAAAGLHCTHHVTVADNLDHLHAALLQAADQADVIIVTGGLGPTEDDITRDALAAAAGVPLLDHAPSRAALEAYFESRGRPMPPGNLVQARVPRGAHVLPNTCGTAPGLQLALGSATVFALPGVPFEMREMYARAVVPCLAASTPERIVLSRRLNAFGRGESDVGEMLADLMARGRNPEVGTTAALGVIGVRINAAAPNEKEALSLLDSAETEIRRRLGSLVFGTEDETLAHAVQNELAARNLTVATAESCTGGLMGKLLTDVAGSSATFRGGVIAYANEIKQERLGVPEELLVTHGAVSAPVAAAMAEGARRALGSDYALSATGVAGPGGGTPEKPVGLVYVGLAGPQETQTRELRLGDTTPRDVIRLRTAFIALNLLRRALVQPTEGSPPARR